MRTRVPAVEGWFTPRRRGPGAARLPLHGCGTYAFPAETRFCRNPDCVTPRVRDGRAVAAGPHLVLHRCPVPAAAALRGRRSLRAVLPGGGGAGGREARRHGPGRRRRDRRRSQGGRRGRAGRRHALRGGRAATTSCGSGDPSVRRSAGGPEPMPDDKQGRRARGRDAPVGQMGPQLRRVRLGGRRATRSPTPGCRGATSSSSRAPTPSATATRGSSPAPPSPRLWAGRARGCRAAMPPALRARPPSGTPGRRSWPGCATSPSSSAPTPHPRGSSPPWRR